MTQQQGITTSVLDEKVALVSVSIGMFGGYRRATAEQILKLGGKLPNSKAVTEGSIKVFPNDAMKGFQTNRRRLFRDIAAKGIKALGSSNVFAIPKAALAEIEQKIADAAKLHAADKADLDANYDAIFEKHVADNQEAEGIIRNLKVDRATAIAKLHFSSTVFSIKPLLREGEDEAKGVAGIVAGLAGQLFEEIATDMAKLAENEGFTEKRKVGQKTLRPLKAAAAKLKGLEFLDPRTIGGCISLIDQVLAMLPSEGYIEDSAGSKPFSTLFKLVETLADEHGIIDASSRVANGKTAMDVLFPPAPVAAAPAPTAVAPATAPVATKAQPTASRPSVPLPGGAFGGRAPAATRTLPRIPVAAMGQAAGKLTAPTLF